MIFARRALQRRLNELRGIVGDAAVAELVGRLNKPGRDRLAIMWEVAILHALSHHGTIRHQVPLATGKRPDITFRSDQISFVADVTSVSDEGVDEKNPYEEFSQRIEALKKRLGLKVGGVNLKVFELLEESSRGRRRLLRLPPLKKLDAFIKARIEPALRSQMAVGKTVLRVSIDDEEAGFDLTIDPAGSPYSTGSYGAYANPSIKTGNPLYNALKAKAVQLRGAEGLCGVIAADGDTKSIRLGPAGWNEVGSRDIAMEFLRQHTSVGFVLLITVREEPHSWSRPGARILTLDASLDLQRGLPSATALGALFNAMLVDMPKPVQMPINAARMSKSRDYGLGHHGGHRMAGYKITISSRELMELLAGRRTAEEIGDFHDWRLGDSTPRQGQMPNPFERALSEGRLPVAVNVTRTDENDDDDWLEFDLSPRDPAITPFR